MLSPALIKQIRQIELRAGHLATDALSGEYLSAFKGQGMEFDEVREYLPSDDVRAIDWNVTARMEKPYIKVFKEEREMTLILLVDVSASQDFGSVGRSKREVAAEFAAVLAFLAVRNQDKVGLLLFSDHVEKFIPPKKGRGHIFRLIEAVLSHEGSDGKTDLNVAVTHLMRVVKRKSLCFVLSDFQAQDYEKLYKQAARRHDLVSVLVRDQREWALPRVGLIELFDPETGESMVVDASERIYRDRLVQMQNQAFEALKLGFLRLGSEVITLDTGGDLAQVLFRFLKRRERRR